MNVKRAAFGLFLAIPAVYAARGDSIQDTLTRFFTGLHDILTVEYIKWGLGFLALGIIFYGVFSAVIKNIPIFNDGQNINSYGKMISVGFTIGALLGIYTTDRMGLFGNLKGLNLLLPGIAVSIVMILSLNRKFSASKYGYIAENSRGISMFLTALLMFFLSGFMESPELIPVGIGIVITTLVLTGLSHKFEEMHETRIRTDEHYREKEEKRREKEEKKVLKEQKAEMKREKEMGAMENYIKQYLTGKEDELNRQAAQTEKEEDQIIHKIYGYLEILNNLKASITKMDKQVAKGYATNIIDRVQSAKTTKQQYQELVRNELQKLTQLLVQEASLKEKQEELTDQEIRAIEGEVKNIQRQLKGEERDIILERKEIKHTVEEAEKAMDRGEITRIEKEEKIHNDILADLIKKKYAANKEKALLSKFNRVNKYEQEEVLKIRQQVDMEKYVEAAKELKKLLEKVREEEQATTKISKEQKEEAEKTEDIKQKELEAENLLKKERKVAKEET